MSVLISGSAELTRNSRQIGAELFSFGPQLLRSYGAISERSTTRRSKEHALNKLAGASAIVNSKEIAHGTSYLVGDFDYIVVAKSTDTSQFTVILPEYPHEGRKVEKKGLVN